MRDFLKYLRERNKERSHEWTKGAGMDALYASNELGGECGEVLNEVKKLVREERGWVGSRSSKEKLAEEIADVQICLDSIAAAYGIDIEEATIAKFNKTSEANGLQIMLAHGNPPTLVAQMQQLHKLCREVEDAFYDDNKQITVIPVLADSGIAIQFRTMHEGKPYSYLYTFAWADLTVAADHLMHAVLETGCRKVWAAVLKA